MSTPTPGPWVCKRHGVIVGGAPLQYINGSAQQQIAMACVVTEGDRDANAAVMAAGLDLLAALRALVDWMPRVVPADSQNDAWERDVNAACAAIAKAEGRS